MDAIDIHCHVVPPSFIAAARRGGLEGRRPHLGSLILGHYAPDGRLIYAGGSGTGMDTRTSRELRARLEPLAAMRMPLAEAPPRETRFGSPLVRVERP